MPADYERCPEFAGPTRAVSFENTGLRFPEQLGPQSEVPGQDYGQPGMISIGTDRSPYLRSSEEIEAERAQALTARDTAAEALRDLFEGAARSSGADVMTARRTATELLRHAAPAGPSISDQVLENIAAAVEKAVRAALDPLAGKPRRPHRRVRPVEDVADGQLAGTEPEPDSPPQEAS